MAGLIKAALVPKHGYIPANLHLRTPTAACLPRRTQDRRARQRADRFPTASAAIAGVNSFGFGGTNAHVVLAEPPAARRLPPSTAPAVRRRPCCRSRRAARKPWSRRQVGWPDTWPLTPMPHCRIWATRSAATHAPQPPPHPDRRQHRRSARTTSGPRRRRRDRRRPHRRHRAEAGLRVHRHGPAVVEDVPRAARRLSRLHREHRAQRPGAVPLRRLVAARRTPP